MCASSLKNSSILGQRLNQTQGFKPKKKLGISVSIVKCAECSLVFPEPIPIPENISDHYRTPAESYWKPEYFQWSADYFSPQIQKAKELLNYREGMLALDIGAGIGKALKSLESAGFEAIGIEPSLPFYEKAISTMKIDKNKIYNLKVEEADFKQNHFDFITFGAVFEHLYEPAEVLKKTLNWIKPGGIIHIEVPSSNWLMAKIMNLYFRVTGTNYVTNLSPMHSPFHIYEFDLKSFSKIANSLGFEIKEHYYIVCSIYHFPKILHPALKWIMKKTNTGMQLTLYLKKKQMI